MSERNPVKLFVSHAWEDDADYHRVFEYLESTANFYYLNLSAPEQRPPGDEEACKDVMRAQIRDAEAVILLTSMYDTHRRWIDFQMHAAKAFDKPIIAMEPFGGVIKTPEDICELADEVVEWNERSMVDAILRQARHEDTQRWEVIDFP
ncbi:MAG TPA: TIR domain-containing protein [Gammaproteobacteria bacterium]|nr:TIR domain-containing protein [Gammaproteobacteria bacterium]